MGLVQYKCGKPRPETEWVCSCGTVNKGKFCIESGAKMQGGKKDVY